MIYVNNEHTAPFNFIAKVCMVNHKAQSFYQHMPPLVVWKETKDNDTIKVRFQ